MHEKYPGMTYADIETAWMWFMDEAMFNEDLGQAQECGGKASRLYTALQLLQL